MQSQCTALQQSEPKLHTIRSRPTGRQLTVICKTQSAVCYPSAAVAGSIVTTVLALLHDAGEAALSMHHPVFCVCVCVRARVSLSLHSLAVGVLQTRYVLERGCGMCALLSCYATQIGSLLPPFRHDLSVSYSMSSSPRSLKVGPTASPETSVRNF